MYSPTSRAALLLALTFPLPAYAADNVGDTETVVVTATRTPTDTSKIGSSISVITSGDMLKQQTVFVTDVLQTVPGVFVTQNGARGNTSSVQLRGEPGYDTFVLVDGMEVSDPTATQTTFDFSQQLANGIDRIEILRGSQSVLYGGDAVGGVVNILTKRGTGDFDGLGFAEGGSFGTYNIGTRAVGGLDGDRFGYNVGVQYLATDGISSADSNLPGNKERDAYNNISSSGRFDYAITDDVSVKAVYRYTGGLDNFDAQGGPNSDQLGFGDYFQQYAGRVSSEFHLFDDHFTGEVGASFNHDGRTNFNKVTGISEYFFTGERNAFDFKGVYNFDDDNLVVFGAETKRDTSHTSGQPGTQAVRTNGYYAMFQTTPAKPLTLTLGVRLDDNQRFGDFTSWRGTLAYNIEETGTKLKASYATGFRAPGLFELFGVCCGGLSFGNPNLKPETSNSWDVGFEQKLVSDTLQFGATYFQIDTNDLIQFITNAQFVSSYENVPGVTASRGVETYLAWTPIDNLNFNLAYTFNEANSATGARLFQRPRDVLNVTADYTFFDDRADLNLNVRYVADSISKGFDPVTFASFTRNLGAYAVVDFGASYKIFDQTEIYGRAENLFDQHYETDYGYGTQGQSFYFGVRQHV
ncbi:MAG TPA: TonB-dependent receptor [Rhizomicrobium sp.]|nr:TonB-dependent receptor [Rhizomicrobium sp.]